MKHTINKDISALLIAILLMTISIITQITNYAILNHKHYIGFVLIIISTILYFKKKQLYVYIFLLTIVCGIVNLIDLFYWNVSISISNIIMFNPIFLTLLIIFLASSQKEIHKIFPKNEPTAKIAENTELVKLYEVKFKLKSEAELKIIADLNSAYVHEAKIASTNILLNKSHTS